MPIPDAREDDVLPFYYFVVAFSAVHLVVGCSLFVRQRKKFPVIGHNIPLAVFFATTLIGGLIVGALQGAVAGETCSVAMATVALFSFPAANMLATQAIHLWYEYNLADERMKTAQAEAGVELPQGWFARNRGFFQSPWFSAAAVAVSLVEIAVGGGVLASLEDNDFADEVECLDLLAILITAVVFCIVLASIVMYLFMHKFKHKRDGFGLKRMLKWLGLAANVASPPLVVVYLWEAFDDLPYYAAAIRVLVHFVAVNMLVAIAIDHPVYMSFDPSAQRGMSSILEDTDSDGGEEVGAEDEQVREVVGLAGIELRSPATSGEQAIASVDSADEAAPEVFSSGTLALTLADILHKPKYAAQMASLVRHLIGEFDVEGLLFFYRVQRLQKFAVKVTANAKRGTTSADLVTEADARQHAEELPHFSTSSAGDNEDDESGYSRDVKATAESELEASDPDVEVAWKALAVYFEFLAIGAQAQINVSHRVSTPILRELEDVIVDFKQLTPQVAADDLQLKRPLDTTVFDAAQQSVVALIERDPFVRWRNAVRERIDFAEANADGRAVDKGELFDKEVVDANDHSGGLSVV